MKIDELNNEASVIIGPGETPIPIIRVSNRNMAQFENENTEFKRELNDSFEKEVVAFLNSEGGTVYIGIEDDGTIRGVKDYDRVSRSMVDRLRDRILPSTEGLTQVNILVDENKAFVPYCEVRKGNGLFYLREYGRSAKGCVYRIGTSVLQMSEEEINRRMRLYGDGDNIEVRRSPEQELTFSYLRESYRRKGKKINEEHFEKNRGLILEGEGYNVLARLVSDQCPLAVSVARFEGKDRSRILSSMQIAGESLIALLERTLSYLSDRNYLSSRIDSRRREDTPLFDIDAVREILVNAFAHGDYTVGPPRIQFFSDRLEITSKGPLPRGQSRKGFLSGESVHRNPALCQILHDLGFMEGQGYGMNQVLQRYPPSIFEIEDSYVKAVIPYERDVSEELVPGSTETFPDELPREVVSLIRGSPTVSLDEISKRMGLTRSKARRVIISSGMVRRVGPRHGGHWEIIE